LRHYFSTASTTNPISISHTISATVAGTGNPQSGVNVTFTVVSGPNEGEKGWAITDSNGQATFTYTSNGASGVDSITASLLNEQNATVTSNTAMEIWSSHTPRRRVFDVSQRRLRINTNRQKEQTEHEIREVSLFCLIVMVAQAFTFLWITSFV
jgi:hypothetical protein